MPTRTTLVIAAVLCPLIRTAVDTHDAIVDLFRDSGADHGSLWIGPLVFDLDADSHRFALGVHLSLSGDASRGEPDGGARLEVFVGPLAVAVEYLGAELVDPAPAYAGGRAA